MGPERQKIPQEASGQKKKANCESMWERCKRFAKDNFIPLCKGIAGEIGSLTVDSPYCIDDYVMPIDHLIAKAVEQAQQHDELDDNNEMDIFSDSLFLTFRGACTAHCVRQKTQKWAIG